MAKWIIKINPKSNFRITDCLAEVFSHDGILALENKQRNPQEGDILYLYQIGPVNPGLCGVTTVIARSEPREQPEWQQRYNQLQYEPTASRLLVRVELFSSTPVKTDWRPNAGITLQCPAKYFEEFDIAARSLKPKEIDEGEVARNGYIRVTEAQWAEISPLHAEMARRFERWLTDEGYRGVHLEKGWIDVRFNQGKLKFMAELKICYDLNTRQAIRGAIGQVLEYNHYSQRKPTDEWWIILDQEPALQDADYVEKLRVQHQMPVYLGYEMSPMAGRFIVLKP